MRRTDGFVDLDVVVDCSSGTYIRALARDLGAALGVGGHLTALRRTRIGPFGIDGCGIHRRSRHHPPAYAGRGGLRSSSGALAVSADEARDLRHGKRLLGAAARLDRVPAAAIDPSGALVGIVERRGDDVKSVMNLPEEASR